MTKTRTGSEGYVEKLGTRLTEGAQQAVKAWKTQAKRTDAVGQVSYRGLELVHGGLGAAARSLGRMERATQPPQRPEKPAVAPIERPKHAPAEAGTAHAGAAHGATPRQRHGASAS